MKQFSLLQQPFSQPSRPLPVALGQLLANTPIGKQERHALLGRIYNTLSPLDKIRCREELQCCKLAKRGALEARVA